MIPSPFTLKLYCMRSAWKEYGLEVPGKVGEESMDGATLVATTQIAMQSSFPDVAAFHTDVDPFLCVKHCQF